MIDDCDPEKMGVYLYDDGSGERLAVFSQNKLWFYRTSTGAFEKKVSYWGEISKVSYFNGVLAVAIDSPASAPLPPIAANHACLDDPVLRNVREVLGFDSDGVGTFLFSVKDSSNKYFVVVGPSTEFIMDDFFKVEVSVSESKLSDVILLPGTNCGYQFAALSPEDHKIAYGYYKHTNRDLEPSCPESWMRKVSIPLSTSPVSLSFDKINTLVVLDATDQASKLISFALGFSGETFSVSYSTTVDLGSVRANFVRFNSSQGEFVTDAPSSSEGRTLTRVSRTRMQRASIAGSVFEFNPDLMTTPLYPPAPTPVIR